MQIDFNRLEKFLKVEYKLYKELYKLAKEKQDLISNEEIEPLENITALEREYLEKIQQLEDNKSLITDGYSLPEIIDYADKQWVVKLNKILDELFELAEELKMQNDLNKKMVKNNSFLTNLQINALIGTTNQNIYSEQGKFKEQPSSILNQKA